MDLNAKIVDDLLTRKASPPAANTRGGVSTPPAMPANNNNHGNAGAASAATFKRIFQLQQRVTVLVPELGACIKELLEYNVFPRLSANDDSNEDAAAIILELLRNASPASPYGDISVTGSSATINAAGAPAANGMYGGYTDISLSGTANTAPATAQIPSWDAGSRGFGGGNSNSNGNGNGGDVFTAFGSNNSTNNNNNNNSNSNTNHRNTARAANEAAAEAAATNDFGPNNAIAFVEFKRSRFRKYVCDDPSIEPGSYVLVDGDRGTDCGLLVQMIHKLPDGQTSVVCMDGCDIKDEKVKLESGRVIREAREAEVDRLHNTIASAEAVALKTCRQRCQELGIDIDLLDVEYQFDMKKIAFYFDCDHSVDFRSLVRELYRTFGARIWMENINPKVKNSMPDHGSYDDNNGNNNHHGGRGGRGGGYRSRRY